MKASTRSRKIAARLRAGVVEAFRRMARGVTDKAACERDPVLRSGGQAWTKQLG